MHIFYSIYSYLRKSSVLPSPPSQPFFFNKFNDGVVGIYDDIWFLNSFDLLAPKSCPLEDYFDNREASW